MPGAPCENSDQALRTMDFPSKDRFLFVGGPLDGKRCHVEMTTHGPENIIEIGILPEAPKPDFLKPIAASETAAKIHRYIRIPLHGRNETIHFIYQHEEDHRNIITALIEGYRKP